MADSDFAICNLALLKTGDTGGLIGSMQDPSNQAQALALIYPQTRDELLRAFRWPFATRRAYPAPLGGATWVSASQYSMGDYVSYAPSRANVPNMPERVSTFVYVSLQNANSGNAPDSSPKFWVQISRAAWAFAYQLPGDLIAIQGIYHRWRNPREELKVPYAIEYEPSPGPGAMLLTDGVLPGEHSCSLDNLAPKSIEVEYTARVTDPKQFPPDFTEALVWGIAQELCMALRKDPAEAQRCALAFTAALSRARTQAMQEIRRDMPPVPSFIAARATSRRGGRGW